MNPKLLRQLRSISEDELYKQLYTDHLTGALNRRAFEALGTNGKYLAIVDADSLKWVNDNMGHRAGDHLLRSISEVLIGVFGRDSVYRVAGDEFVVCCGVLSTIREGLISCRDVAPGISFGVGRTLEEADALLRVDKHLREKNGCRAIRGEKPSWI